MKCSVAKNAELPHVFSPYCNLSYVEKYIFSSKNEAHNDNGLYLCGYPRKPPSLGLLGSETVGIE